jgi:hypothetical protein
MLMEMTEELSNKMAFELPDDEILRYAMQGHGEYSVT